ncbi:protein kinase C-like 1 [Sardina pilchardus]|uniref:protein kinase C-like 1 n=1 Tax=Sardina pilchardus TaxID=27697 RepID=UPI002E11CAAD
MNENVYSLLQEHRLDEYSKKFLDLGVKDAKYLVDGITAEQLMSIGLSSVEKNRFRRMQEHIKELGPVSEPVMHQVTHKTSPELKYPEPRYPEPRYPEPKESSHQVVMREDTRHKFILSTFGTTTYCSVCRDHIWGLTKQGYKCTMCSAAFHKKCVDKITEKCTEANRGTVIDKPHRFNPHNYKVPTYCAHCGGLLAGLYQQGCRCDYCTMDVHAVCQKKVAKPCINYWGLPHASIISD